MLETLDYTICIGSTPTFLYFDLYFNTAYIAHYILFLSDEGPMLETLDYTIRIGSIHQPFYISISISTLPMQHTKLISILIWLAWH